MENKDNQYFKWSVTRALNPVVKNARLIALMHVYVRLANFTTKPRFRSANLQILK